MNKYLQLNPLILALIWVLLNEMANVSLSICFFMLLI